MKQPSLTVSYMIGFEAQGLEMYVKFPLDIVMEDCGDSYTNVVPPSGQLSAFKNYSQDSTKSK